MIEQIALPSREAIAAKRRDFARALPSLDDQQKEIDRITQVIEGAQKELDALLAAGYRVIAFTPFQIGHGTNFVLYKPDAPEDADTAPMKSVPRRFTEQPYEDHGETYG